jgi:acetyl-CoA carboxylase biotin carboxylase subunit
VLQRVCQALSEGLAEFSPLEKSSVFKKLLVANRGEIALRVIRACREMGVSAVAVYSDIDRNALHVRYADEAYLLGPAPSRESYLNIKKIIEVASRCGAEAIHPGYGFLAENANFAETCQKAGIVWVGPPPEAIRRMGDKVAARRMVGEAGVPVVPGTDAMHDPAQAAAAAVDIGFPVLVKAVAGGGGKGIRLVKDPAEMQAALRVAGGEALSAFGDNAVYIEKFMQPVRHIEVQVLADDHGNVVALGERECSIQRRYQKLIEESPSTAVDAELRDQLCRAAVAAARAAGYRNAGTVEFLVDREGRFFFIEMNTRLQVEHSVTEMATGTDLVMEQIRIAAGERISFRQEDVRLSGWSLECRVTAEDPFNNFLPSLGCIDYVAEPSGPGVRVDSALYSGAELPYHYDPMVAKVITWGRSREEAIQRMRRALREFVIVGVETNVPFHLQMLEDARFLAGDLSTAFLERDFSLTAASDNANEEVALLATALLTHLKRQAAPLSMAAAGDRSPWRAAGRTAAFEGRAGGTGWRPSIS